MKTQTWQIGKIKITAVVEISEFGALLQSIILEATPAAASRRQWLDQYAGTEVLLLGSHFSGPAGGLIVRDGTGYRLAIGD